MMPKLSPSWWLTDQYDQQDAMPEDFEGRAGPHGVALVKAWPSGMTSEGWGLQGKDGKDGFMLRYPRNEFNARRVLYGYNLGKWAFAFVMRSVNMICIDIDGKNGGVDHASELLGNAPPTLAETSKSGTGYHLFYTMDGTWDPDLGFGVFGDSVGIVQGVDIRATGCVYHHPQQRWNGRRAAPLPQHIYERLLQKETQRAAYQSNLAGISALDEWEKTIMHDELLTELKKPIPAGKRNNTLFAIGGKLRAAEVPDWQDKIRDRADQVGMGVAETEKLVRNIEAYSVAP